MQNFCDLKTGGVQQATKVKTALEIKILFSSGRKRMKSELPGCVPDPDSGAFERRYSAEVVCVAYISFSATWPGKCQ